VIAADSPENSARTGGRQPSDIPVVDYDPFSTEFFEDPQPMHKKWREAGPVVWLGRYSAYAVARYAEVKAVLDDPTTFCSGRGVGLSDFGRETPWRPKSLILEADPPAHTRVRAVLNRVLSLGVTRKLHSAFQAAADALVDELITRGSFDGIRDLAEAFPMSVFPDALGIKEEGREHLLPYAGFIFNSLGPDNQLRRDTIAGSLPHQAYVVEQCRRENLAPGGFGACVHDRVDAGEITAEEAPLLVRALLTAGVDTTISSIGAALHCLARFPEQLARLRVLARNAFEEAIRFESPLQTFFRTTTQPVRLSGATIEEGEKVLMFLGAANRDPRRWVNADCYDVDRRVSGHVGFGGGIHMCVGQFVARLEGEVILSALARKVTSINVNGPVKRRYNNTLRGLASLPLTIEGV
jgi:cytochrome P450